LHGDVTYTAGDVLSADMAYIEDPVKPYAKYLFPTTVAILYDTYVTVAYVGDRDPTSYVYGQKYWLSVKISSPTTLTSDLFRTARFRLITASSKDESWAPNTIKTMYISNVIIH